jgi:hypothetical protein
MEGNTSAMVPDDTLDTRAAAGRIRGVSLV